MITKIFIEGGGNDKDLKTRCREGFRRLLEKCGLTGRMPRLVACGGRQQAYEDFVRGFASGEVVALLVDSEEQVVAPEKTWEHLERRKEWQPWSRPNGASDEQVFLMTTCMETWIVADRESLRSHYKASLQESALPALHDLEKVAREKVLSSLVQATRDCSNCYRKSKRSYEVLAKLNPDALRKHLPAFARMVRILTGTG